MRYGRSYRITPAEVAWAMDCTAALYKLVQAVCIERLEALEEGDRQGAGGGGARAKALIDDLPLFAAMPAPAPRAPAEAAPSKLEARLREAAPDELTPRAALDLVYELRAMLGGD